MSLSDAIEEFLAQCKQQSPGGVSHQADLARLQQLNSKKKLDDHDILFLKENLPPTMFESFLLEKATQSKLPFKSPNRSGGNLHQSEDDQDSQQEAYGELSVEFKALKKEIDRKLHMPVFDNMT